MAVKELVSFIPPPTSPLEVGDQSTWSSIEAELGSPLPSDYRDFVSTYGTGLLANLINVFNPFSRGEYRNLLQSTKRILDIARTLKIIMPERMPYAIFPEIGGMLPWATDENGNWYFWLTEGSPDEWPVIAGNSRDVDFQRFDIPMTTFLAKALKRKITCKFWASDYPTLKYAKHSSFRPVSYID
ncbi:SMI1/KNR4 family protein [Zavarzinella formosa]|uniref:SMI1/KNR4 family protein n=1 Tax=Zavarzinella formosa TaxID=360055 RepID=UPI000376D1F9|nr:SMI1/KNR4 family protein [Zavarzinella formosa]